MENTIEIKGIRKSYKGKVALDVAELMVPAGSVCALLGANGAGKSTLMKILAGLEKADQGSVSLLGSDPWKEATNYAFRLPMWPRNPSFTIG